MTWIRDGDKNNIEYSNSGSCAGLSVFKEIAIQRGTQEISIGYWARASLAVDC